MEAQRQPVQVFQHLHRDLAHGAVAHAREDRIAQFVEQRAGQLEGAVAEQQDQRQRQGGVLAGIQIVDDVLQHQRDADIGDLRQHQETERQQHAAAVGPQERHQGAQCPDVVRRRCRACRSAVCA